MIEVWAYDGVRPASSYLRYTLKLPSDVLFLTATGEQAKYRQDYGDAQGFSPYFPHAMDALVNAPILTATDIRILIGRYGRSLSDQVQGWQVRHDAGVLTKALISCWERGTTPGEGPGYASPAVADRLRHLDAWLRAQPSFAARPPRSLAVRRIIDQPALPPTVVMEGFTFLTPLQEHLVRSFHERGRLVVIVPYRPKQPRTFAAIQRTWADWWGEGPRWLDAVKEEPGPLTEFQRSFDFLPYPTPPAPPVGITAAPHRHEEVRRCLTAVATALDEGVPHDEIAIVTPRRGTYDRLLLEEADLLALPIELSVPPQLLLLTPVGRFILLLYELWQGGRVELDHEHLAGLLGSGWLGADAQQTASEMRLLSPQLFRKLSTIEEWRTALIGLQRNPPSGHPRVPSSLLNSRSDLCATWLQAIETIEHLTERLFGGGPRTIGEHVTALLNELDALAGTGRFESEQEVIGRVREALEDAAASGGLEIDVEEFGDVLVALAKTYEDAAEDLDEEPEAPPGRIWVTTPNGIDNIRRRVVFFLGLDSEQMPRPFVPGWPTEDRDLDHHLDVERYLFATTCRAATDALHLSFSHHTARGVVGESAYLRALGADFTAPALDAKVSTGTVATTPIDLSARRDEYSVVDLAVYGICPYRYRAELLDPAAGVVDDEFHLRLLAEADLFEMVLERATETGNLRDRHDLNTLLHRSLKEHGREVGDRYPGLGQSSRRAVVTQVREQIDWVTNDLLSGRYAIKVERAPESRFNVVVDDRSVRVSCSLPYQIRSGKLIYPVYYPLLWRELSFPEKHGDRTSIDLQDWDGAKVFRTVGEAQQFLSSTLTTFNAGAGAPESIRSFQEHARRLAASLIIDIEHQRFPRRTGEHCAHCPVRDPCLGLEAR